MLTSINDASVSNNYEKRQNDVSLGWHSYTNGGTQASTIDLLTSLTPSPFDLRDAVTMGGKQVGACLKMVRLILSMAAWRETRSAFVMIAWNVHLWPPD